MGWSAGLGHGVETTPQTFIDGARIGGHEDLRRHLGQEVQHRPQGDPDAPEPAFWAAVFGGNHVYVDREHDLVVVLRWTPDLEGVVTRTLAALR